jgi:hypothetical protein
MSFRKRKLSAKVTTARKRIDGIRSIDPKIDLNNGLTDAAYEAAISKVENETEEYNTYLSQADGVSTRLKQSEKELGEFSQRMLNAVGSKFGYNSVEYKKAGGTPKGEKKRTAKNSTSKSKA